MLHLFLAGIQVLRVARRVPVDGKAPPSGVLRLVDRVGRGVDLLDAWINLRFRRNSIGRTEQGGGAFSWISLFSEAQDVTGRSSGALVARARQIKNSRKRAQKKLLSRVPIRELRAKASGARKIVEILRFPGCLKEASFTGKLYPG